VERRGRESADYAKRNCSHGSMSGRSVESRGKEQEKVGKRRIERYYVRRGRGRIGER